MRPDWIINSAAYTAVDLAEQNAQAAELINATAIDHLVKAARSCNARLIHFSTDYVFDGKQGSAYQTSDMTGPLSVYGTTKLAGETYALAAPHQSTVIRTSWLYSGFGGNFVKTMLKLMTCRQSVQVVADQYGSPTYARNLGNIVWRIVQSDEPITGLYHWSDGGVASWFQFAEEIFVIANEFGLIGSTCRLEPIKAAEYPTRATRPGFSSLDCSRLCNDLGVVQQDWKEGLRMMLKELVLS